MGFFMDFRYKSAAAVILLSGAGMASAEGDAELGKAKFETCLGCHGVPGYHNVYPTYKVPKVAGQSAKYIESALKGYRDGQRKHDTMHANAINLSDDDIADIGAYLSQSGK